MPQDPVERPRHPGEIQRLGQHASVVDLPAGAGTHEAPQLLVTGPVPLRGLLLEGTKRANLPLRLDHLLYHGDTERTDQLVLQVSDAHEKAKPLQARPSQTRPQTSPVQAAPEIALLSLVAQPGQPDTEPLGPEHPQETPDIRRTPHRHDENALSVKITAAPRGERFERGLIAHPLDEHNRARPGGCVARICRRRGECDIRAARFPGRYDARLRLIGHLP